MSRTLSLIILSGLVLASSSETLTARAQGHGQENQATSADGKSVRITMEALHRAGGVPPGWKFTLPPGDAAAGRQVFMDFKCYACHAIKGEQFPLRPGETARAGPELTGMGQHHPAEYLAESIVSPSVVLVEGPGYIGGDGRSIMPSSPDMSLGQLVNLVAYLKSLTGGHGPAAHHHEPLRELVAGEYRIRLVYRGTKPNSHEQHGAGHNDHGRHARAAGPAGHHHLMAFITDVTTGEPVPYLPVSASIQAGTQAPRTVKLSPMVGQDGFRYGANVVVGQATTKILLTIGATSMRVMPGAGARFSRPRSVTFDWK